jgi:hypothetical protein
MGLSLLSPSPVNGFIIVIEATPGHQFTISVAGRITGVVDEPVE